jgi:hypothetical protein
MSETETKAKVLMGLGVIGALLPIALWMHLMIVGSLPSFWGLSSLPYITFVLPLYILGLMVRKFWGFYIAVLVLSVHFVLFFLFAFILQHAIYFLECMPIPLWRFELFLLQETWSWMLSVLLMFLGITGNGMLLKIRYGFRAFGHNVGVKGKVNPLWEIIFVVSIIALLMGIMMPALARTRHTMAMECASNLERLRNAAQLYTEQFDGLYPTPNKWCDLLLEGNYLKSKRFLRCPAVKGGRCHFAINPNCSPNSPNDVVLLFETKDGWNQYGGPELLTFDNHKGKNAFVLFNGGFIKFINPEEAGKLKWKPDEAQEE